MFKAFICFRPFTLGNYFLDSNTATVIKGRKEKKEISVFLSIL